MTNDNDVSIRLVQEKYQQVLDATGDPDLADLVADILCHKLFFNTVMSEDTITLVSWLVTGDLEDMFDKDPTAKEVMLYELYRRGFHKTDFVEFANRKG